MIFQPEFIIEKEQCGKQLYIQECHEKSLDRWITERHYLGYAPCGARLRLWIIDERYNPIGAMMWGRPTSRMYDQEIIMELTRMYFIDNTERFVESRGLAMARKYIRIHFPKTKLVLSYSSKDGGDHCGIVFAADNWCPFGITSGGSWRRIERKDRKDKDISKKIRWVRSP